MAVGQDTRHKQEPARGSPPCRIGACHVGEAVTKHSEHRAIRPEDIDAEIDQLQEMKAAVADLRSNGYRADRLTQRGGRPRYLLRALNRQATKSNINTCRNHSWRPAEEGARCRLCRRQGEMRQRWKQIQESLATICRSGAKRLPMAKPARSSSVGNHRPISNAAPTSPPAATRQLHIMVVLD